MLTLDRLNEVLSYEEDTGIFRWSMKVSRKCVVGSVAGTISSDGYVRIKIDRIVYLAHRLAWFYVNGEWSANEVDHRDLNRGNNRWGNLREATHPQNEANKPRPSTNTSGFKGVSLLKGRWRAQIQVNRKAIHLGLFDTPEQAHAAYVAAAEEHFGEFSRAA